MDPFVIKELALWELHYFIQACLGRNGSTQLPQLQFSGGPRTPGRPKRP